jgi:hypothetical protein
MSQGGWGSENCQKVSRIVNGPIEQFSKGRNSFSFEQQFHSCQRNGINFQRDQEEGHRPSGGLLQRKLWKHVRPLRQSVRVRDPKNSGNDQLATRETRLYYKHKLDLNWNQHSSDCNPSCCSCYLYQVSQQSNNIFQQWLYFRHI